VIAVAWHDQAYEVIRSLAEGASSWAIPWISIHEFLAIATPSAQPKTDGPAVHDARIAALGLLHGVRELWTAVQEPDDRPSDSIRNGRGDQDRHGRENTSQNPISIPHRIANA
jgi:uncharacterized protein